MADDQPTAGSQDIEEIYVAAYWCVCFEENGSSHSFYSNEELLEAVGEEKLERLKANNELFWTVFGRTLEGPSLALEDFDNEAAVRARADVLHAEFVKNVPPFKLPDELQKLFDGGTIAAGKEEAFLRYYESFKLKAESDYCYGAMADEDLDVVARAFNGLSAETLADVGEIGREARQEVTRIGEKLGLEARSSGFRFR